MKKEEQELTKQEKQIKYEKKHARQRRVTIFEIAALCVLVVVGCVLIFTATRSNVKTSTLTLVTRSEKVETEVFAVRKEKYISNDSGTSVVAAVKDGSHVAKNGTVAYCFNDSTTAERVNEINSLEEKIAYYKSIQSRTSSGGNENTNDSELLRTQLSYVDMIKSGSFSSLKDLSTDVRNALISKQVSAGQKLELTDQILSLEQKLNEIKSTTSNYTTITTDVSGYYIYGTDGYENAFDYDKIDSMTDEDIYKSINSPKQSVKTNVFGKMVTSFYWYLVATVPQENLDGLNVGSRYSIDFTNCAADEVKGVLTRIVKDDVASDKEKKQYFCIFKVDDMSESLAEIRREKATITIKTYTGLKVEKSAIRDINGVKSIFLVSNGLNYDLAKVKIEYEAEDYDLIKTREKIAEEFFDEQLREKEELGEKFVAKSIDLYQYPALYDTYVVDGRGVEDGKKAR